MSFLKRNKNQKQNGDYDKIVEILEDRFWYCEPLPEVPWVTMAMFTVGNPNYEDYHNFDTSIDKDTTFKELRDKLEEYANNARRIDNVPYDMSKGPTAMMQLADELDSVIVELDRAIEEKNKIKSRGKER